MPHKHYEVRFSIDGSICTSTIKNAWDINNRLCVPEDSKASFYMSQESDGEWLDFSGLWSHLTRGFDMVYRSDKQEAIIPDELVGHNVRRPLKRIYLPTPQSIPAICFVINRIEKALAPQVPPPPARPCATPQKVLNIMMSDDGTLMTQVKIMDSNYEMSHAFAEYLEGTIHEWD